MPPVNQSKGSNSERSAISGNWVMHQYGNLALELPFTLEPAPDVLTSLPERIRSAINAYDVFDSGATSVPHVTVVRITYKPTVPVNLDNAIRGATAGAVRGMLGIPQNIAVDVSSVVTRIDGLDARRASYSNTVQGDRVYVETICLRRDQTMWQVQLLYVGDELAAVADRIFESIRIQ